MKNKDSSWMTDEQKEWLEANRLNMNVNELAKGIGMAHQTVRTYLNKNGLKWKTRRMSTEYKDYILDNYRTQSHKVMAEHLGLSRFQVSNFCCKEKLYKITTIYRELEDDEGLPYVRPDNIKEGSVESHIHQVIEKWKV